MSIISLSQLPLNVIAVIKKIEAIYPTDPIAQRLGDLGFLPGTQIQVVARTPFKKGPLVVQISHTRFALRWTEAHRLLIEKV